MGSLRNYSAIATKIRAMESRLLQGEDYEKLIEMESVPQVAEYLSRIPAYRSVLEGRQIASVRRADMERLLEGTLYYDFAKLYRFGNGAQKEVLKLYFRKYEIAEIKHALRHILIREDRLQIPTVFHETMQRFTDIHLDEMAQAQTTGDLAHALRDTDYSTVLEKTGVLEKESLFDCEIVLDLFYFTELWRQKNKLLKKKECRLWTECYGTQIDMLNMTWIYRAKKYYHVPETAVYGLLIPVRYRLRDGEMHEMVTAPDVDSLEQTIRGTYYGRRFKGLDMSGLESFYREFLQKMYANNRRREPYSIAVITGYLQEREEEIRKLTAVLEGIWYGVPKEELLACVNSA